MNEIAVVDKGRDWRRLKALVLDRQGQGLASTEGPSAGFRLLSDYEARNLGLDEFFAWYGKEPQPGFTKVKVAAWRVALEARGLAAQQRQRKGVQLSSSFRCVIILAGHGFCCKGGQHSQMVLWATDATRSETASGRLCRGHKRHNVSSANLVGPGA